MSADDFDAQAIIEAMSALLKMQVAPEYLPGVSANLKTAHAIAQTLLAVELPDETEPAPVFSS
jgi:precorrin-4 methylase